jgi:hypothetical protein
VLAANAHREVAIAQIANALVTIGLALWLTPLYGILGLALASLLGDVICSLTTYPYFGGRYMKLNPLRIYAAMLRSWISVVPLMFIIFWARFVIEGLPWAVFSTLAGIVMLYPTLLIALGRANTQRILETARTRLRLVLGIVSTLNQSARS